MTLAPEENTAPGLPSSMVGRMTLILEAFASSDDPLSLEEVMRRTQLPRSTAHRILEQLTELGWVQHHSQGYSLGGRAQRLASRQDRDELRRIAAPVLHDLYLRTGLVAHLATVDGSEIVFLDKVGGPFAATLPSDVGTRWWVPNAAIGKAYLAALPPEKAELALRGCPQFFDQLGPAATEWISAMFGELGQIRQRRGLAFERGEGMPGVGAVACAIEGPDGPVGALSVCGDVRTMHFERLVPLVADAARRASAALRAASASPVAGNRPVPGEQRKTKMYPGGPVAPGWWWSPERYLPGQ